MMRIKYSKRLAILVFATILFLSVLSGESLHVQAFTWYGGVFSGNGATYTPNFNGFGVNWVNTANQAATDWTLSAAPFGYVLDSNSTNKINVVFCQRAQEVLAWTDVAVNVSTNQIVGFTININQCALGFYDGSQCPTLCTDYRDLATIIRHELGHGLGLCHSAAANALMYTQPTGPSGYPNRIRNVDSDAVNGATYLYSSSYNGVSPESWSSGCDPQPANTFGTYDDQVLNDQVRITYGGRPDNWQKLQGTTNTFFSTMSRSNVIGARANVTFNGSDITLFYSMDPTRGQAQIYIDNAAVGSPFSMFAPQNRRQVGKPFQVTSGQHTFEVRATGGGYIDVDAFAVNIATVGSGTYDNTNAQIRYIGTWTSSNVTGAYNNTLSSSNISGSLYRFTFTGSTLQYFFSRGSDRGFAAVTIDGVDFGNIDMYSATTSQNQSVTYGNLSNGVHVININVTGQKNSQSTNTYVNIDRLVVT